MTNYIYHHDDLDGIAAAAMINLAYPMASNKFIESTYPFTLDESSLQFITNPEEVTVFIVDISLNDAALKSLLTGNAMKTVSRVVWIDHHETSEKSVERNKISYPPNFEVAVDQRRSGAYLTYNFLHPDSQVPAFLKVIDTYDRHDGTPTDIRTATSFNLAMLSDEALSPTSDIWKALLTSDTILEYQIGRGEIIHKYLDAENKRTIDTHAVVTKIRDIPCLMVNAKSSSILFDSVPYDKYPLRLAWRYDGGQYRYTLYSDGSINCCAIAGMFGGGGHPGAAGFSSDQLLFLDQHCEEYPPH